MEFLGIRKISNTFTCLIESKPVKLETSRYSDPYSYHVGICVFTDLGVPNELIRQKWRNWERGTNRTWRLGRRISKNLNSCLRSVLIYDKLFWELFTYPFKKILFIILVMISFQVGNDPIQTRYDPIPSWKWSHSNRKWSSSNRVRSHS